jgi:hypothetical protein
MRASLENKEKEEISGGENVHCRMVRFILPV